MDYDVIIVGAGPAGLSAALILGRCRRQVLVLDTDKPRNAASHAMHGFLSRDGIQPAEFRRIARQQLTQYRSVKFARKEATAACQVKEGFEVTVADGQRLRCRKLLLATGVVDELPPVDGIGALLRPQRLSLPILRRLGVAGSADRRVLEERQRRRARARIDRVEQGHRALHRWRPARRKARRASPRSQDSLAPRSDCPARGRRGTTATARVRRTASR